jgi:hypothetical protein
LLFAATLIAALQTGAAAGQSVELRLAPADHVYFNVTNARRGYGDLVVQTIAVGNTGDAAFQFEGLRITVRGQGRSVTELIPAERALAHSAEYAGMAQAGMDVLIAAQTLDPDGLTGLFDRPMRPSPDALLEPGEAVLTNSYHFSTGFPPDAVDVVGLLRGADGQRVEASAQLAVVRHEPAIRYASPVSGVWLMHALPSIQSHHRLNLVTEFAVDFFKVDGDGEICTGANRFDAATCYGYGALVRAAADGEVVFVIDDQVQDRRAMLRAEGEDPRAAGQRIQRYMFGRMRENFRGANGGNIITIRHEVDGVTEYSSYAHLAAGSVRVAVGDRVRQGEVIAGVGDTGDSAAVHLHFQINAGPDAFMSRSLPAVFFDLEEVGRGLDPGRFVRAPEAGHPH